VPAYPAAPGFDEAGSDAKAIALAERTVHAMGGYEAWTSTRYVTWKFFGRRRHLWDRRTGDLRIDTTIGDDRAPLVVLTNLRTGEGGAWIGGEPVTGADRLAELLDSAEAWWINDSYWLLMPYKLKDTGVTLRYVGEGATADGSAAEIVELTFREVGRTPQNKYRVYVGRDSGLVEQWDFFADATDAEPRFSTPWRDWHRHGHILLSGDRGVLRGRPASLTDIAVFAVVAPTAFTSPERPAIFEDFE
jgi:hypothetical protein